MRYSDIIVEKTFDTNPTSFYVYTHHKKTNGKIFYVGKGYGNRYIQTYGRSALWKKVARKHGVFVKIHVHGLQEWAAFEFEKDLISLYGRLDNKTGVLVNFTDGGDGMSGLKRSKEAIEKTSSKLRGRKRNLSKEHLDILKSKENRDKIRNALMCKTKYTFVNINGETYNGTRFDFTSKFGVKTNSLFGTRKVESIHGWGYCKNEESVEQCLYRMKTKRAESHRDSINYSFVHSTGITFVGTRYDLFIKYNLPSLNRLSELFNKKKRKSVYGWSLLKEENGTKENT